MISAERNSITLGIAGLNIVVRVPCTITLSDYSPLYRPFLDAANTENGNIDLEITLVIDSIPDIRTMNLLFDTGQSWSLFREKDNYFFVLRSPDDKKETVWVAHYIENCNAVTVYCGIPLVNRYAGKTVLSSPFCYPLDQLLIMYVLAHIEGMLIHASGIVINGKGYIFPGRSGAGKTTLSQHFQNAGGAEMMSDDRVIVRKINGSFRVYGTPWAGDAGIAENKEFPLKGIFFIHHGDKNRIREMTPREAIEKLMPVTSIPWFDRDVMPRILDFCEELVSNIPAYQFYFKPDAESVDCLKEFVSGNED